MAVLRDNRVKIFLTVFLVYLFYIAPTYLTATTERYISLTKAIVDDRTFTIDKYYDRSRDVAAVNGHYYIGAAPGLSFMAVPIYITLKPLLELIPSEVYNDLEDSILNFFFAFFLAVLPGALIAVLLYDALGEFRLKENEKILIVFASAFGTILFYYSTRFLAHAMSAFVLFGAFYILLKCRKAPVKKSLFFLIGLLLGTAVLLDYMLIIGSALLLAYALVDFKKEKIINYIVLFLGAGLVALLYFFYHYSCFGSPFVLATAKSRLIGPIPLSLPHPGIVYELTFGAYRGLFVYMPILLVSVYGIFTFFRRPEKKYLVEILLISLFSVLIFFAVLMFCNKVWPWGGDFGPRYFVCLIPFLMIPAGFACGKNKYKIIFWIAVLSIFINWCGVQYGDADRFYVDVGLFLIMGLKSGLTDFFYQVMCKFRNFNVVTHMSPFVGFVILLILLYKIWKPEHARRIPR